MDRVADSIAENENDEDFDEDDEDISDVSDGENVVTGNVSKRKKELIDEIIDRAEDE